MFGNCLKMNFSSLKPIGKLITYSKLDSGYDEGGFPYSNISKRFNTSSLYQLRISSGTEFLYTLLNITIDVTDLLFQISILVPIQYV